MPIGVPPQIHPMPSPPFAVPRITQQPIDNVFVSRRRFVREKRPQLLASRRQSDQVEINAPEQDMLLGRGTWFDARGFEFRRDKRVNFISNFGF